jgi:hypothetical protein
LIKRESTSELLRFTIRHVLNQVHRQPEYLVLKQEQRQKQAQNNHQQQLHSQVVLPSTITTASHQPQVPNTPQRKNMPVAKMILSSAQTNLTNYNDNVWNTLQAESSEIFREQQQAARQPNQYYRQQERASDDNDDYLFNLE